MRTCASNDSRSPRSYFDRLSTSGRRVAADTGAKRLRLSFGTRSLRSVKCLPRPEGGGWKTSFFTACAIGSAARTACVIGRPGTGPGWVAPTFTSVCVSTGGHGNRLAFKDVNCCLPLAASPPRRERRGHPAFSFVFRFAFPAFGATLPESRYGKFLAHGEPVEL